MLVYAGVRLLAGVRCEAHRSGLEKGPAATVLPSLWGEVSDGNLLSTTFVKTKVQPATFVWSNVMMAIFAQSNGAAGHLRASERAAGAFDAVGRGTGDLGGVDRVADAGGRISW